MFSKIVIIIYNFVSHHFIIFGSVFIAWRLFCTIVCYFYFYFLFCIWFISYRSALFLSNTRPIIFFNYCVMRRNIWKKCEGLWNMYITWDVYFISRLSTCCTISPKFVFELLSWEHPVISPWHDGGAHPQTTKNIDKFANCDWHTAYKQPLTP